MKGGKEPEESKEGKDEKTKKKGGFFSFFGCGDVDSSSDDEVNEKIIRETQ